MKQTQYLCIMFSLLLIQISNVCSNTSKYTEGSLFGNNYWRRQSLPVAPANSGASIVPANVQPVVEYSCKIKLLARTDCEFEKSQEHLSHNFLMKTCYSLALDKIHANPECHKGQSFLKRAKKAATIFKKLNHANNNKIFGKHVKHQQAHKLKKSLKKTLLEKAIATVLHPINHCTALSHGLREKSKHFVETLKQHINKNHKGANTMTHNAANGHHLVRAAKKAHNKRVRKIHSRATHLIHRLHKKFLRFKKHHKGKNLASALNTHGKHECIGFRQSAKDIVKAVVGTKIKKLHKHAHVPALNTNTINQNVSGQVNPTGTSNLNVANPIGKYGYRAQVSQFPQSPAYSNGGMGPSSAQVNNAAPKRRRRFK